MINLIPPEGHRLMKQEYILRVFGTLSVLLGVVFLILTVALVPTYILIDAQISDFALEIEKQSDKEDTAKLLDKEIELIHSIVGQLKTGTSSMIASQAVDEIQKIAEGEVVFKAFIINEPDKRGEVKIQAQGVAPTRETLAKFKTMVEASPFFEKAEVPISDLARDVDLPFMMTITVAQSV